MNEKLIVANIRGPTVSVNRAPDATKYNFGFRSIATHSIVHSCKSKWEIIYEVDLRLYGLTNRG